MEERSWFWRKIGFWFVPVKRGTLRREEWAKVQRLSRSGRSRRARRILVALWIVLLGFQAWVAFFGVRLWVGAGLMNTVFLSSIALFAFHRMQIGLARPTLEDMSVLEYGKEFDSLRERQRGELFQRVVRDGIWGRVRLDEREAELRLRAEGAAYRLLRPGLLCASGVYWAVCLFGPFAAERRMLAVSAVAFSWLTVFVLVLPTMVRMWTQPDDVGDPRVVAMEREA
jgi:hypothetical protein